MIFNWKHHNHALKYPKPTATLSQDENARYLQYFQIYDASINFDPKNVSIVKTLDKNKISAFDYRKFEIFFLYIFCIF